MVYAIISSVSALVGLWAGFFIYKKGLIDGVSLAKGKPVEPIKNPVAAVVDKVVDMAAEKEAEEEAAVWQAKINEIYGYQVPLKREGTE